MRRACRPTSLAVEGFMAESSKGFVWLVGAGPGHPGYLTLRGLECLQQADVVLYDRLVNEQLLAHAPPTARRICVEQLHPEHPSRWPHIQRTLIETAKQGLRVVRLKGGDPFVFGRGGEEAEALHQAGIAYEIVPGISAALGVAACAGIPLTHRDYSSAVALVTGHEEPGRTDSRLNWSALAAFPGTLVFYMGLSRLDRIAEELMRHGKAADTPAAVVHLGTLPTQKVITAPLSQIAQAVRQAAFGSPSLILISEVVALRERLRWFESRPLFGQTILITRPPHQADELRRQIEALGGQTVLFSPVEIAEVEDWSAVDAVLAGLREFDWLVFTSSNGVDGLIKRLRQTGRDLRALGHLRLAAIGPATAEALRRFHLDADVVPGEYNSEGLVSALAPLVAGQRVLLARTNRGIELLREELAKVAVVEQIAVYLQRDVAVPAAVREQLNRGGIDAVTLTSSMIARGVIASLDEDGRQRVRAGSLRLVTISPRTSAVVREMGLPIAAEAREYTSSGVLAALLASCGRHRSTAEGDK